MFQERLKTARISRGLTQKAVSEELGIKLKGYQHYEYGFCKPTFEGIIKICKSLNISADYLLGLEDG